EARREALLEATKMRPEDLKLLHEIARIEEQEGDWEAARTTLESALPLDKTRGTKERIALLVMRYGDEEEGYRRLAELSGEAADADAVLGLADAMIGRADWERVAAYLAEQRPRFPDDYRLAYLHGIALVEDQRIGEAQPFFLELLDWKTEIAKAAANPAVPTISRSLSDYYKGLPEGVSDLYVATAKAYPAFQYRQALQQSAGQYRSQLIRQGGGRLVPLPSSLLDLRSSAITHLAALGQGLDDEERTRLGEAMLARGVKSGDLLLEIPLPNPHRGNYPEFPAELLDRHPDRLDLWAKAVIDQSYQSPATIDAAMMARCYEKFREDYPMLAFCAAVRAAASGAEEGAALLDQALAEQPPLEEKDSAGAIRIPLQTLSSSLAPATPFRGQQQTFLPDRFRAPLIERYLRYLDIVRKDTTVQKQATTANFFDATDEYGWLLRGLDDLDPYADHLDAEIARYEEMRRSEPVAKAGQSTLLRQIPWIVHDRPLFTEPSFPPLELPGFPPNVLVQFATLPNYPAPNSIPTEAAVRQIDRVRSPVLRALFAHLAGDKDRAEKEIEAFLGEVTIDPATRLQRLLLGASWFGTVRENPARAIALLDEARSLTTDKDMRRTIDSFLVSFARKAASGDTEKKDEALLAAGREAALRLRYGLVGPQHRGELTAALIELGLEGEAEQLQQKSVAKASPAITRTAVAATAPPDLYDRVKKLADDGKMEEAVKLATQNLRPALRAYGGSMGGNVQLDYQLIQFLQRLNSQKPLLEEIKTAFDPGDPAAAEPSALLEWATFQLLLGEFEPALASYLAAQGKLPEHKQDSVKAKVAAILSFTDPGNAAPQLAGFDDKTLAQCFAEQQALRQIRNYFGYDRADTFRQKLNIARTFAL
ncbi:MAG TPA: hypothetical protein PLA50_04040, partial [Bacteroidia bacterium]|nr:hypothetical protein [Bacteroidia bacterium]